jgi:hypothetical protein
MIVNMNDHAKTYHFLCRVSRHFSLNFWALSIRPAAPGSQNYRATLIDGTNASSSARLSLKLSSVCASNAVVVFSVDCA